MGLLVAPTLQQLIANVRSFLGERDENNSRWTDADLTSYLNEGVRRYFGEVVQDSEGLFTVQTDLNITSGIDTVAMPDDFFKIVRLYRNLAGDYIIMNYNNSFNQSYTTNGSIGPTGFVPSYYMRGNSIVLRMPPNFSETAGLRLEYIQFPDTMINGGDAMSLQVSPIFKQLIEVYAVYKAKLAESIRGANVNTYGPAAEHLGEIYQQFKDAIRERSQALTYVQAFNPEE